MRAKPEYRDRDETEVAVLDALADRHEEGMTVFELRTRVEADIDTLEDALSELKADDLIEASEDGQRTLIHPEKRVVGDGDQGEETGLFEEVRRRLPF